MRAKTDVKDNQWIQKLHSLGLHRGSFLPSEQTERLRILYRHCSFLEEESAKMSNKMNKALRLMNLRLDNVISDITGKLCMAIITAILGGERDGKVLSLLADSRGRKSKQEMQGHWKKEYLLELQDCYDIYNLLQQKIRDIDKQFENLLSEFTQDSNFTVNTEKLTVKQRKGKNQPKFDLSYFSYLYYGVDLFAVEGISVMKDSKEINYDEFCKLLNNEEGQTKFISLIRYWTELLDEDGKVHEQKLNRLRGLMVILSLIESSELK